MKERYRVIITGRVQGVCFRSYTQEKAMNLNITGWVKNNSDRSVEAIFEGEKEQVEKIINWCYSGSPYAQVDDVQIKREKIDALLDTFKII